jgi:hypothetical protein
MITDQVRSDDIKAVISKRMQASKANKVMASILPEFATFQARAAPSLLPCCPIPRFTSDVTAVVVQAPNSWVFKGD